MAIPFVTHDVARAIYYYAGGERELPIFEELPPTIQISYIEEAEAAMRTLVKHIKFLATQVEPMEAQPLIQSVMVSLAESLDPDEPE